MRITEAVRGIGRGLRRRRGQRRLFQAVSIAAVVISAPALWTQVETGRSYTPEDAPHAPVAVVFGAGLWDGEPSPYLRNRLQRAAELYRKKKVRALLVTGDNSRTSYNEPGAMRRWLVQHGVPRDKVVLDYAGFDTWDSCVRARKVFGVRRALLVSQDFHIRRAVTLCRAAGVASAGVSVPEPRDVTWWYSETREIPAAIKAAVDAAVRPDPHFLGPRDTGVRRAVAAARQGACPTRTAQLVE